MVPLSDSLVPAAKKLRNPGEDTLTNRTYDRHVDPTADATRAIGNNALCNTIICNAFQSITCAAE